MSQEQKWNLYTYLLSSKGIEARFVNDQVPDHAYVNLKNVETREENSLSLRFGHTPLTVNGTANDPLGGSVNTLGRLKSLGTNVYRYASAGGHLYRIAGNNPGVWTSIESGLSLSRCSMVSYTPPFSSIPYLYVADANKMLQDNGTGSPSQWGLLWPPSAMEASVLDAAGFYDIGEVAASYTVSGGSLSKITGQTTASTGNVAPNSLASLTLTTPAGFSQGCFISYYDGVRSALAQYINTGNAVFFQSAGVSVSNPTVNRYAIEVVTSAGSSYLQSNLVDSAFGDFDLQPSTLQPTVNLILRINVHNPSDLSSLTLNLSTGNTAYTNGYTYSIPPASLGTNTESVVTIPITSLAAYGAPDIHNVKSFRIESAQGAAVTYDYYSLNLDFGQGPSVLGGVAYDYIQTYFNANTGDESGPSPIMLPGSPFFSPVSLFYNPVQLTWFTLPVDPRVTHRRIYRRGGTLPNGWNLIAQLLIATIPPVFDNVPDYIAEVGTLLNIDNYPPITSTLPNPVNTTLSQNATTTSGLVVLTPVSMANISLNQRIQIGSGTNLETVTVYSLTATTFSAFIEFSHQVGEIVYAEAAWAQPANGVQVGFDRLFVFGDPNNPGNIYFSNVGQPSSFGVENFLTLDDTTDPVMGITPESFGRMYAFTLGGSVYQLVSVNGSIPVAVKTNATHGMFSLNAYMVMDQGIPYYSNDGIYFFNGGTAVEVSQILQWIFRQYSEAGGPMPVQDLTQRNQVNFGFFWDEAFISYKAVDGNRYRVIFSPRDNRWRNDTIPASAQLYERDTATLIYGDDTGMVYQDRTGDQDFASPGTAVPVPYEITTASLDQGQPKNPKWYTELTVDINTNGQIVPIYLLLNNQDGQPQNVIGPFSVNTPVREQINFKINSGLGVSSLNVAFDIVGEATQNFDLFQLHLKALVDAETRQSFDTFWTKYGSEQWKVCKQGYFEYISIQDTIVGCYQGGNMTTPVFTFVLPSTSGNRNIIWIRFPSTKAKLWRFVGVSNFDFQVYPSSHIEVKVLGANKGYQPQPLTM